METIVPEEASRKDQPRGGRRMSEGLLLFYEGILGVERAVVVGDSCKEVALHVLQELSFLLTLIKLR